MDRNDFLSVSAFQVQALNTPGDASRDVALGPGLFNVDLSLAKQFVFTERRHLEVCLEAFNSTNHTNFGNPGRTFGKPIFGVISSAGNPRIGADGITLSVLVAMSKKFLAVLFATVVALPASAQDEVRTVIILNRHGVRAPLASEIRGSEYNAQPWPEWRDATGVLTQHDTAAVRLMGAWYRSRYGCQPGTVYSEANTSQRTVASAKPLVEGLGAGCEAEVAVRPRGEANPLFGPSAAADAADSVKLANAIQGRLSAHVDWWARAFSEPLEEMRRVLLVCSGAAG